jgi:seryl-tRNA synthetase
MLELNYIREHTDRVAAALRKRGMDLTLEPLLEADRKRRDLLVEIESLKKQRNERSREIGGIVKAGGDAEPLKRQVREIGERVAELQKTLDETQAQLDVRLHEIPNVPDDSVPEGTTEDDNELVRSWGTKPEFSFEPKAHWDLGVELGILLLERALIQFMLDLHTREHGYTEMLPPFMVNANALFGTGQLPKFEADLFKTTPGDFYLIPTAEVPVTNFHAGEILDGNRLPLAYCAYTPCFRSEAGSYGKDVRGLIRQHQFNKVELVRFATAESSYDELERLTAQAEEVLRRLALPYRVVTLCSGDLGFSAAKTYDLEVWLPAQGLYREISSCSNFEGFQARRAKIRYRREKGDKPRPVHTLNGSGLAVGRTLVAILENYQQSDGTIHVPEVLRPYMYGKEKIEPRD